jgi:hypothetical protein
MKQAYFPWYQAPKKIELIESDGIKKVLLNGRIYMSWASWDSASQRMVIAQIASLPRNKICLKFSIFIAIRFKNMWPNFQGRGWGV